MRTDVRRTIAGLAVWVMVSGAALAQQAGVLGTWVEPEGARIEVHRCGQEVCLKLLTLSRDASGTVDAKNPDTALRTRPLVGLEIGRGFRLTDPAHAEDGTLYDPKSGKTYHGVMESAGDKLKLRGYVGIKALGRTEVWTRENGS